MLSEERIRRIDASFDAEAAAQCAAEGIVGMNDTVAALARSALAAPIVQRAIEARHHRELFVAAQIDGRTVEVDANQDGEVDQAEFAQFEESQ